jgi:hypothetical protein
MRAQPATVVRVVSGGITHVGKAGEYDGVANALRIIVRRPRVDAVTKPNRKRVDASRRLRLACVCVNARA